MFYIFKITDGLKVGNVVVTSPSDAHRLEWSRRVPGTELQEAPASAWVFFFFNVHDKVSVTGVHGWRARCAGLRFPLNGPFR